MDDRTIIRLGIFAFFALAAFGTYWLGRRVKARVEASQWWPATEAVVVTSTSTPWSKSGSQALISYRYKRDGAEHTSRRLAFGGGKYFRTAEEARAYANRFPVGSKTTVYVNPSDPRDAVLDRVSASTATTYNVGVAIFAIMALALPFLIVAGD